MVGQTSVMYNVQYVAPAATHPLQRAQHPTLHAGLPLSLFWTLKTHLVTYQRLPDLNLKKVGNVIDSVAFDILT